VTGYQKELEEAWKAWVRSAKRQIPYPIIKSSAVYLFGTTAFSFRNNVKHLRIMSWSCRCRNV